MGVKLLLTDDDSDDRELFAEALSEVDASAECITLPGVQETLSLLERSSENLPDLMFLDINLPEMNGWDCLKEMKSRSILPHLPVVMYSTSSYERDVDFARELGALALITKPADFTKLKAVLSLAVDSVKKGNVNELSVAARRI